MAQYTLTINPTPADSTVIITTSTYTKTGNSVTVEYGAIVSYEVLNLGYTTVSDTITIYQDESIDVTLQEINYPTPQIDFGTTVNVISHQTVTYWVNKDEYISVTGMVTGINQNTLIDVPILPEDIGMEPEHLKLPKVDNTYVAEPVREGSDLGSPGDINEATVTIRPNPTDAEVTLTCGNYTQVGNSITVGLGRTVNWLVEKQGYNSTNSSMAVIGDQVIKVNLVPIVYKVIIENPQRGTIAIYKGSQLITSGSTSVQVFAEYNTILTVRISKPGYNTETINLLVDQNINRTVNLNPINYTCQIVPTPSDAIIKINGNVSLTGQINAPFGSTIEWEVSKEHYITQRGIHVVNITNNVVNVDLELENHTYSIEVTNPEIEDATITFTVVSGPSPISQTDNSITVKYGTVINWEVSASGYQTKTSLNDITVTQDTVEQVTLLVTYYTLTINPTPSDASVTLTATGYTQVGNTLSAPIGTVVFFSVSKIGYITQSGNITISRSETISVNLNPASTSQITITPTPNNATVSFYVKQGTGNYLYAWASSVLTSSPIIVYTLSDYPVTGDSLYDDQGNLLNPPTDSISNKSGNIVYAFDYNNQETEYVRQVEADVERFEWVTKAPISLESPNTIEDTVGKEVKYIVSATGYLTSENTTTITQNAQTIPVVLEPEVL